MNISLPRLISAGLIVAFISMVAVGCVERDRGVAGASQAGTEEPTRIVSLIPSATSILYSTKGPDQEIAGVTRYCRIPDGLPQPPVVGGILDVSLEAVAAARPDLVIGSPGVLRGRLTQILGSAGVRLLPLDFEDVDDVRNGITEIGRAIGRETAARELLDSFDAGLAGLGADPVNASVMFVAGTKPLVVAGDSSFQGQLIHAMGLSNVVRSNQVAFPTWSLEQVIKSQPDVIIDGIVGGEPSASLLSEAGVDAVVVRLPDESFLLPGPDAVKAAEKLRAALVAAIGSARRGGNP